MRDEQKQKRRIRPERSEQLQRHIRAKRVDRKAAEVDPAQFFQMVGKVVGRSKKMAASLGGAAQFTVSGDKGGIWIVDLDRGVVEQGIGRAEVAVRVALDASAFSVMVGGAPTETLEQKGLVRVRGDREWLNKLAMLLTGFDKTKRASA